MGTSSKKCEKGKDPKTCSPGQIKECHGETKVHSCQTRSSPEKKK